MAFLMDPGIYLGIALFIVVLLLLFVFARVGYDWEKFKAHWRTTGKGAPAGIVTFVTALALLALLAYHLNTAQAGYDAVGVQLNWRFTRQ